MDAEGIKSELRAAFAAAGGQSAWARAHRISAQYVADVLSGRRDIGPKILSAMRYRKVVTYCREGAAEDAAQLIADHDQTQG